MSNPSTQTSVGGLTSSAARARLVPPTKVASTVKARGRTQRVARTVMGTSFGRWRSILLAPTAVNVAISTVDETPRPWEMLPGEERHA